MLYEHRNNHLQTKKRGFRQVIFMLDFQYAEIWENKFLSSHSICDHFPWQPSWSNKNNAGTISQIVCSSDVMFVVWVGQHKGTWMRTAVVAERVAFRDKTAQVQIPFTLHSPFVQLGAIYLTSLLNTDGLTAPIGPSNSGDGHSAFCKNVLTFCKTQHR